MFLKPDLDEHTLRYFNEMGVQDEQVMLDILNGLDQIAEIGYCWYINHKSSK